VPRSDWVSRHPFPFKIGQREIVLCFDILSFRSSPDPANAFGNISRRADPINIGDSKVALSRRITEFGAFLVKEVSLTVVGPGAAPLFISERKIKDCSWVSLSRGGSVELECSLRIFFYS
jgi:hypothetical protein